MTKQQKIGIAIWFISLLFVLAETHYFGYNMFAESWAEFTLDSIGLLMCIAGLIIYLEGKKETA